MAMLLHPLLVTQFLYGRGKRSAHVMPQTEGVAHLMAGHEAHELTHEFVVELHLAGTLVLSAALDHIPFGEQVRDIMEPADVCLDNLTATRVDDMRSVGILHL